MQDIDTFLIETHSNLTAKQQAEQLTLPYHMVITRRIRLYRQGRISASARAYLPIWSSEEDEFLEGHYSNMTIKTLCRKLGRSETAIVMHKRRLGLHRTDDFYTAAAMVKMLEEDIRCEKIKAEYLEWEKACLERHKITEEELREYLVNCVCV